MKRTVAISLALFVCLCIGRTAAVADEQHVGQKFEGFNLQGYNGQGDMVWTVNGETADVKQDTIEITNVDADTYGEQPMNVKAKKAFVRQGDGNMRLEEDVTITSEAGTRMLTDSLEWRRDEDLVTTKDNVIIQDETKGLTVTGKGLDAHPGLSTAKIKKDVKAMIDVNQADEDKANPNIVTITCDGPMVIDRGRSMATFEDNVVAVQNDQTLKADRMEIYFDEEKKTIQKLICIGHVVVVRGENQTYAKKMVYNAETQKMTLSGKPKLILLTEGENAITAPGD